NSIIDEEDSSQVVDAMLRSTLQRSIILENHLDDIVRNMKPLIVNQIFEPSHYDDMFISRKALTPVFSSVL
ncbi:hypothetical protein, partial [Staphylococcus aureus]|uniref:hypothetical protein n=1 Tax=Staphylococcus aureus TaxID=1280 RepID=UPI0012B0763D|nr:hypothetical protein [Staphylococcus aureus]